jgi:hypothetical protein
MFYILHHKRESRTITCVSFKQAQREFFFQWRDPDGSIPWLLYFGEYEIDPLSGHVLKAPCHV